MVVGSVLSVVVVVSCGGWQCVVSCGGCQCVARSVCWQLWWMSVVVVASCCITKLSYFFSFVFLKIKTFL